MKEFVIIFGFVGLFGVAVYFSPRKVRQCSTVAEVGGCDRSGSCGVSFVGGGRAVIQYPVKGQTSCYDMEVSK